MAETSENAVQFRLKAREAPVEEDRLGAIEMGRDRRRRRVQRTILSKVMLKTQGEIIDGIAFVDLSHLFEEGTEKSVQFVGTIEQRVFLQSPCAFVVVVVLQRGLTILDPSPKELHPEVPLENVFGVFLLQKIVDLLR